MDLSLDKRLLKIFRDLNDNVAPTDSPHFIGIPRVPSPNGENVKQIANTEYATRKINELYDLIFASVTAFENRLNKLKEEYNTIIIDTSSDATPKKSFQKPFEIAPTEYQNMN